MHKPVCVRPSALFLRGLTIFNILHLGQARIVTNRLNAYDNTMDDQRTDAIGPSLSMLRGSSGSPLARWH